MHFCSFIGSAASCPIGGSVILAVVNSDAVMLARLMLSLKGTCLHNAQMDYFLLPPTQFIFPQRRNIRSCEC